MSFKNRRIMTFDGDPGGCIPGFRDTEAGKRDFSNFLFCILEKKWEGYDSWRYENEKARLFEQKN